jgi:CheY-like chemotaxis protein
VRDNGIGIAPQMLPRVFDMFTQGDGSLEKAHGGLGIGLTSVRRLVELHGGSVEARSEGPGRGSEFMVRLPLIEPAAGRRAAALPPQPPAMLPRRRILVVDDNADAAASLAMLFTMLGDHEVHVAGDGRAALSQAESLKPELIVLDIGMPGMNGYDACRALRTQPWSAGVALVALSGWGQEEHQARAREAGFDHFLVKPVGLESLQRLLASLSAPAT